MPFTFKIFILLFVVGIIYSSIASLYTSFTGVYNQSTGYKLEYKALEQNQVTTYDNYYLAFKEKTTITNLNKETFLTVTSIIMSERTDGPNVAWKWSHENQNIPYEEFTVFYKELSTFITARFAENSAIENKKQDIAKNHNLLLTTFPGVIYNHFLHLPLLEYKEGFVSADTKLLFNK